MSQRVVIARDFCAERFAAYGAVIDKPAMAGERQFYSDWLGGAGLSPVFHVNRMEPTDLPMTIDRLEQHPHAAQAFVPLDVSRYLVTVAPTMTDGAPDLAGIESFVVPANLGVIYAPRIWHAGASVLDRMGAFAVLMWRGAANDDVFIDIAGIDLVEDR